MRVQRIDRTFKAPQPFQAPYAVCIALNKWSVNDCNAEASRILRRPVDVSKIPDMAAFLRELKA